MIFERNRNSRSRKAAAHMSRRRILSIRASAAFRRVQQRSLPLFRIDSRAPLESFPGVAWPRCLANLRQLRPARLLRSNARHASNGLQFSTPPRNSSLESWRRGSIAFSRKTKVIFPQFLRPSVCVRTLPLRGKDRDIRRTIREIHGGVSPSFHHDRLLVWPVCTGR